MSTDDNQEKQRLLELLRDALARDTALREKHQIGEKFRFVRDRLQGMLTQLEQHMDTVHQEAKKTEILAHEHEITVYVYLYNAQGAVLQTWHNMLTPKLFYEYSVNRPIYTEKNQIDNVIQSKANHVQHAFLSVAILPSDILAPEEARTDPQGNKVVKVREGSLRFERLISLNHNRQDYILLDGSLHKKP
jgi:intracellular multiplication protein IcmQ